MTSQDSKLRGTEGFRYRIIFGKQVIGETISAKFFLVTRNFEMCVEWFPHGSKKECRLKAEELTSKCCNNLRFFTYKERYKRIRKLIVTQLET